MGGGMAPGECLWGGGGAKYFFWGRNAHQVQIPSPRTSGPACAQESGVGIIGFSKLIVGEPVVCRQPQIPAAFVSSVVQKST